MYTHTATQVYKYALTAAHVYTYRDWRTRCTIYRHTGRDLRVHGPIGPYISVYSGLRLTIFPGHTDHDPRSHWQRAVGHGGEVVVHGEAVRQQHQAGVAVAVYLSQEQLEHPGDQVRAGPVGDLQADVQRVAHPVHAPRQGLWRISDGECCQTVALSTQDGKFG